MAQARRKAEPVRRNGMPRFIPVLLLLLAAVAIWRLVAPADALAHHPEPRPDVTAAAVVDATRFASAPDIATIYAAAARVPHVLDGLYCHCDCSLHSGHRSLLTCFESDHGAACDICLAEARLAAEMTSQGRSLDDIRSAIDQAMGG